MITSQDTKRTIEIDHAQLKPEFHVLIQPQLCSHCQYVQIFFSFFHNFHNAKCPRPQSPFPIRRPHMCVSIRLLVVYTSMWRATTHIQQRGKPRRHHTCERLLLQHCCRALANFLSYISHEAARPQCCAPEMQISPESVQQHDNITSASCQRSDVALSMSSSGAATAARTQPSVRAHSQHCCCSPGHSRATTCFHFQGWLNTGIAQQLCYAVQPVPVCQHP